MYQHAEADAETSNLPLLFCVSYQIRFTGRYLLETSASGDRGEDDTLSVKCKTRRRRNCKTITWHGNGWVEIQSFALSEDA